MSFGITIKHNPKGTIVKSLQDGLAASHARVLDLFRAWDTNNDGRISREEFTIAFLAMAPKFTESAAHECFKIFDPNGDGEIEFHELNERLQRREGLGGEGLENLGSSTKALRALEGLAADEARKKRPGSSSPKARLRSPKRKPGTPKSAERTINSPVTDREATTARESYLQQQREDAHREIADVKQILARTGHVPPPRPFERRGGKRAALSSLHLLLLHLLLLLTPRSCPLRQCGDCWPHAPRRWAERLDCHGEGEAAAGAARGGEQASAGSAASVLNTLSHTLSHSMPSSCALFTPPPPSPLSLAVSSRAPPPAHTSSPGGGRSQPPRMGLEYLDVRAARPQGPHPQHQRAVG